VRRFFSHHRLLYATHVALLVLVQGRVGATTGHGVALPFVPPTGLKNTIEERVRPAEILDTIQEGIDALTTASLQIVSETEANPVGNQLARPSVVTLNRPLSAEAIRMWMQSYNAGPYALLKYKGNVPYRETRAYTPKVFRYYQQNLSESPYEPYIQQAAEKWGIDPQLLRAVIKTESNFNPKTVSHAGARGLVQVMPVVWSEMKKRYGFEWDYSKEVFDPEKNIDVACAYLAWLRYEFLPRHFTEFESNPIRPPAYISDRVRKEPETRIATVSPDIMEDGEKKETQTRIVTASPGITQVTLSNADGEKKISIEDAEAVLAGTPQAEKIAAARAAGKRVRVRIRVKPKTATASAETKTKETVAKAVASAKDKKSPEPSKKVASKSAPGKAKNKS
jgi:hypothetical protein